MNTTTARTLPLFTALTALLAAFPASAQPPPETPRPEEPAATFLETLEVEVVNLDVMVSDSRGISIPTERLAEMFRGVGGARVGLLVRPGPHRLAIGVRDELGDVVSTLRLEHDVVAPGNGRRGRTGGRG